MKRNKTTTKTKTGTPKSGWIEAVAAVHGELVVVQPRRGREPLVEQAPVAVVAQLVHHGQQELAQAPRLGVRRPARQRLHRLAVAPDLLLHLRVHGLNPAALWCSRFLFRCASFHVKSDWGEALFGGTHAGDTDSLRAGDSDSLRAGEGAGECDSRAFGDSLSPDAADSTVASGVSVSGDSPPGFSAASW